MLVRCCCALMALMYQAAHSPRFPEANFRLSSLLQSAIRARGGLPSSRAATRFAAVPTWTLAARLASSLASRFSARPCPHVYARMMQPVAAPVGPRGRGLAPLLGFSDDLMGLEAEDMEADLHEARLRRRGGHHREAR